MFGFSPLAVAPVADDAGVINFTFEITNFTATTVISQVNISQTHNLTASDLTSNVVFGSVALQEEENLTIPNIELNTSIEVPSIQFTHNLVANDITLTTSVGSPILVQLFAVNNITACLLYTSPSPRDSRVSRMPSSA